MYVYMVSLFDINQPGMQRVESHGEWSVGAEVIASLGNTTPGRVIYRGPRQRPNTSCHGNGIANLCKMYINNLYKSND